MTKTRNIVLAGFILSSILPSLAAAGQSTCSCSAGSSATVTSVSGDVTTSGVSGFAAGEAGQVLSLGSEIYTGADSSANISFGSSCNVQLSAQSKAVLVTQPGSSAICVEVSQSGVSEASTAQQNLTLAGGFNSYMIAGVVAAAAAAAAVVAAGADDTGGGSGSFNKKADPVSGGGAPQ